MEQHQTFAVVLRPPRVGRKSAGVDFLEITEICSDTVEPMLYSFAVRGLLTTHSLAAVLEQFTFCSEAEMLIKSGVLSSPATPPQGRR